MSEKGPKSAYELAMEKLKTRDREQGLDESRPVSQEQKRRIQEIRSIAQAKLAEIEILWKSRRAEQMHDHDAFAKAEGEYVIERRRIEERAESEIGKIRKGK